MAISITSAFRPVPEDEDISLSPSMINTAQTCMRLVAYKRARLEPEATAQNLVFGTSLHWVIEGFLKNFISAEEMSDRFVQKYREVTLGKLIAMAKSKSTEVAENIGQKLASGFPAYFANLGLRPVVIEGRFRLKIAPHVYINLVIDFVGVAERPIYGPDGELLVDVGDTVILDWKTASMTAGNLFVEYGYQLTYYWLAVKLACVELGIRPPKACGYAEGFKPNAINADSKSVNNSVWKPVHWARRSETLIEEAVDYALIVAKRLRAGEFHRAPHMAYNSPCDTATGRCDMAGICLEASLDGYNNKKGYALFDLI
jgi:hypothetical protein